MGENGVNGLPTLMHSVQMNLSQHGTRRYSGTSFSDFSEIVDDRKAVQVQQVSMTIDPLKSLNSMVSYTPV